MLHKFRAKCDKKPFVIVLINNCLFLLQEMGFLHNIESQVVSFIDLIHSGLILFEGQDMND